MSEDARERILVACAAVIARSGLRRFRMSDVAREAGVSIGLLAYHFGDRDGLLAAALDHVTAGTNTRAAMKAAPRANAGADADAETGANATTDADAATDALTRLETLLCSEFGEEPGVREGSTAWNEVRAVAVFEAAQARAVAHSTADWESQVEAILIEAFREAHRADELSIGGEQADAPVLARILTALVEGLSGRWLTGQLTAAEAQNSIRIALHELGLGTGAPIPNSH